MSPRPTKITLGHSYKMSSSSIEFPDSGIAMSDDGRFEAAMEAATNRGQDSVVVIDHDGVNITPQQLTMMGDELAKARAEGRFPPTQASDHDVRAIIDDYQRLTALNEAQATSRVNINHDGIIVSYAGEQLVMMGDELAKARAEGRFPPTQAPGHDLRAIAEDYRRLLSLNEARGTAPREDWNKMSNVVDLTLRITQEIRARDKVAAEKTEAERVKSHVTNMMSGVSAEAKLYSIVQHAVTYAMNNGSSDQAASLAGQNTAHILSGIGGVIKEMAGKGTHGVNEHNFESVLEEVFGMIDFALGNFVGPLDKNVNDLSGRVQQMDGQINRVDGQINRVDGQINRVDGQINRVDGQINRVDGQINRVDGQINRVDGQINQLDSITQGQVQAIGQHVNAIDNHVHSLGNNINAFSTLLNSTNGNVVVLNTQINLLQTIVNMLPRMVTESLDTILPGAVNAVIGPVMAEIEAQLGVESTINHIRGVQKKVSKRTRFFKAISSGVKKIFKR